MAAPHAPQPDFERFLKALRRQEPDRVPLSELLMDAEVKEAFLGRPVVSVADDVEFWYRAGYDYIGLPPRFSFGEFWRGAPLQDGVARYERHWSHEHEGVVRDWADLEAHPIPALAEVDFSPFDEVSKHLPPGMKVVGRFGDIFTTAWQMMGFTRFCYAIYEQPEFVAHIMRELGSLVYGIFRVMADYDCVGALWYSDDIAYATGLMVSPDFLREHLFPWMKKMGELAHERGMPFIYHTDGVLWEVMEDLIGCGVDALQPIEPAAMDIREVKRRYGHRRCLIGNVEVDLLARGTPEEVRRQVRWLLREVAPGGGYCLGSSNTVTYYVKPENYRAMIEEVLAHGRYPICIPPE